MISLRFATATHALLLMAHARADAPEKALSSSLLADSIGANPVVVRRVLADLGKAGIVESRTGSKGGVWLARPAGKIRLNEVYAALDETPALKARPRSGNNACPVADAAPAVICNMINGMEQAVHAELSKLTLIQLVGRLTKST